MTLYLLVTVLPNNPSTYYSAGYDRQQLLMFWADNFTNPDAVIIIYIFFAAIWMRILILYWQEFVAFCDTDTLFVTYVDKSDLFNFDSHSGKDKPVVLGQIGYFRANTGWIQGYYVLNNSIYIYDLIIWLSLVLLFVSNWKIPKNERSDEVYELFSGYY